MSEPQTIPSDGELAYAIRDAVKLLNHYADVAAKRELVVSYRIKAPDQNKGQTNPRLVVNVMTEVA